MAGGILLVIATPTLIRPQSETTDFLGKNSLQLHDTIRRVQFECADCIESPCHREISVAFHTLLGEQASEENMQSIKSRVLSIAHRQGFAFAAFTLFEIQKEQVGLSLTVELLLGIPSRLDRVEFDNELAVDSTSLARLLQLNAGSTYNDSLTRLRVSALENSSLVSRVDSMFVTTNASGELILRTLVHPATTNEFSLSSSFTQFPSTPPGFGILFRTRTLFSKPRSFLLRYLLDQTKATLVAASVEEPFLLSDRSSLGAEIQFWNQPFAFQKTEIAISVGSLIESPVRLMAGIFGSSTVVYDPSFSIAKTAQWIGLKGEFRWCESGEKGRDVMKSKMYLSLRGGVLSFEVPTATQRKDARFEVIVQFEKSITLHPRWRLRLFADGTSLIGRNIQPWEHVRVVSTTVGAAMPFPAGAIRSPSFCFSGFHVSSHPLGWLRIGAGITSVVWSPTSVPSTNNPIGTWFRVPFLCDVEARIGNLSILASMSPFSIETHLPGDTENASSPQINGQIWVSYHF